MMMTRRSRHRVPSGRVAMTHTRIKNVPQHEYDFQTADKLTATRGRRERDERLLWIGESFSTLTPDDLAD